MGRLAFNGNDKLMEEADKIGYSDEFDLLMINMAGKRFMLTKKEEEKLRKITEKYKGLG